MNPLAARDEIIEAIKKVSDPEIGLDVWTLGLIYELDIKDDKVNIIMTFTSPMCPFGPDMVEEIKDEIKKTGIKEVTVEIVFDPPWQPSDEVREMLGF